MSIAIPERHNRIKVSSYSEFIDYRYYRKHFLKGTATTHNNILARQHLTKESKAAFMAD